MVKKYKYSRKLPSFVFNYEVVLLLGSGIQNLGLNMDLSFIVTEGQESRS